MLTIDVYLLDLLGTALFAYGGTCLCKQRGCNLFKLVPLSLSSAVGGGTIRELLLQAPTMFWIDDITYLVVIFAAIAAGYLFTFKWNIRSSSFELLQAFSLAVFVSIGFTSAMATTGSVPIAMILGLMTGFCGGLVRDLLCKQPPEVLRDSVTPCLLVASIVGVSSFDYLGYPGCPGACTGAAMVLTIKFLVQGATIATNDQSDCHVRRP